MKTFKFFSATLFLSLLLWSCSKDEVSSDVHDSIDFNYTATVEKGNGAPSGPHYNLNIIGVPKDKTADMTGNNGHRIFVPLFGKTEINLKEGDSFSVLDANGTDKDGASFLLPNPDEDGNGYTSYSIWMRALGKPGGKATVTTCADADLSEDGYYKVCSTEILDVERTKGRSRFKDVSKTLLTILIPEDEYDDEGNLLVRAGRYTIFDEELEGYFWEYDNNGLKLLQLRFYEVESYIGDES
jgi:hypothetical protein